MKELPTYVSLVDSFSKLPSIGVKTAERLAYAVLEMSEEDATQFASAIISAKQRVHKCSICGLYAEEETCEICKDGSRDHSVCIVVSYPKDALAFERLEGFSGVYHVLGGVISPSKGILAGDLAIDALMERVDKEGIKEVIIGTNPTMEGEMTALFLSKLLKEKGVAATRLAYGLPMGASLDYADSLTLTKALEGRKSI